VISRIDLTEPFGTLTQRTFVAVQEGGQPPAPYENYGSILVCLVKAATPDCDEHFYRHAGNEKPSWFDTPHYLVAGNVVYASPKKSDPLLLLKVCTVEIFDGNCGLATVLFRYDRRTIRSIACS